jgi:hypothetical protein
MITLLLLAGMLLQSDSFVQFGIGTTYWPKDGHSGMYRADGKLFTKTDDHIANRELPLGSLVVLCNLANFRCTITHVRDRGTFGFCAHRSRKPASCPHNPPFWGRGSTCPKGYKYVVRIRRRARDCGFYRGIADMTRSVAGRIHLKGMQTVLVVRLPAFIKPWLSGVRLIS